MDGQPDILAVLKQQKILGNIYFFEHIFTIQKTVVGSACLNRGVIVSTEALKRYRSINSSLDTTELVLRSFTNGKSRFQYRYKYRTKVFEKVSSYQHDVFSPSRPLREKNPRNNLAFFFTILVRMSPHVQGQQFREENDI